MTLSLRLGLPIRTFAGGYGNYGRYRDGRWKSSVDKARREAHFVAAALVHSGGNLEHYYAQHFQGAVFPLAAGLLFYGWRAPC